MFGDLFDEGVQDTFSHFNDPLQRSNKMKPCERRSTLHDLCGLDNQGSTCYLNSLLQTLHFTPEFRDAVLNLPPNELNSPKLRIIPIQLQKLFVRLLMADKRAIQTTDLTNSFGWTQLEELEQHDVQELNRILFSAIENSLKGTSGENIIRNLYSGIIANRIKCLECANLSVKLEDFQDLTVIVSGLKSLENSLEATYLAKERMCNKDQYFCNHCQKKVDAEKETRISSLPQILTFSLMRFSYDFEKRERFKETEYFSFPLELNMQKYRCVNMEEEDCIYDLFSVVIHSGSGYGGHYHAYIRDIDNLGRWSAPPSAVTESPAKVTETKKIVPKVIDKKNPLQLLITILMQQVNGSTTINSLCSEVVKLVGSSWRSLYKHEYGPIAKFLIKNSDIFTINDATSIVSLNKVTKPSSPTVPELVNLTARASPTAENQAWFDFNDGDITSVSVNDIKKQFSGNESAYMLFYRQKRLKRPSEAKENPFYKLPEYLLDLVLEENSQLHQDRLAYEKTLNEVKIQVCFGVHYHYVDGILKSLPDSINDVLVSVDQRNTLKQLRDQIFNLASDLCSSPDFCLFFAKDLPAGMHLIKKFTSDMDEKLLSELKLQNNDIVFVTNGDQFSDVPIGEECTPILINIIYLLENQENHLSRVFPRNISVAEVKIFLSGVTKLTLPITLKIHGKTQGKIELEDYKNLSDYVLFDGDTLMAHDANMDKNAINLVIHNKLRDAKATEHQSTEMIISRNVKLSDLKVELLLKFGMDMSYYPYCRLRKVPEFEPTAPLYEDDIIDNVLRKNEREFILEDGVPPTADEITLYFGVGTAREASTFILNKNFSKSLTVQECLGQMIKEAGLNESSEWNLCKIDGWMDELTMIKDTKLTLEEAELKNGQAVALQEKLPPIIAKTTLIFNLRLFRTPDKFTTLLLQVSQTTTQNELGKAIKSSIDDLFSGGNEEYIPLGPIELEDTSTLLDMKNQIMTLPIISNLPILNSKYLRLRFFENGHLATILRNSEQTLKQLKVPDKSLICVQVLSSEEELKSNEILLSIALKIPDKKIYLPAKDLVWDGEKNCYMKSLQSCISEALQIPVHKVIMAKHFPKKHECLVITDFQNVKKSNKKKGKINLRHNPYSLRDGDTIRVKNKEYDLDWEDFSTEDDKKVVLIKALSEVKLNEPIEEPQIVNGSPRIRGGSLNSPIKTYRRSEVGLKIHVDDFT